MTKKFELVRHTVRPEKKKKPEVVKPVMGTPGQLSHETMRQMGYGRVVASNYSMRPQSCD